MDMQVKETPPLLHCAMFSALVEIFPLPRRGRGLFITEPGSAGQLLVCEKGFAYSYAGEDQPTVVIVLMNRSTKKATMGGQAHPSHLTRLQKLYCNP